MRFDPQANVTQPTATADTRRKSGRLPQETLECNVGTVLDLSAGGMRVLCRKPPPSRIDITIHGCVLNGPLHAVLAWSKRLSMFKYEVGMRFENISPRTAQCLTQIAAHHRMRRVL